jgi:hypothetical protein
MIAADWFRSFRLAVLFVALTCCRTDAQDCRTIAASPPLATLDGPATVERGESELAFGAGFGGTLFDCTHKTGSAWFGRMRRGMTDRIDLGADMLVVQHQDKGTATAKIALRYQAGPRLRLEAGIGVADDSDGKSLNADTGITTGTIRNTTWNRFAALRFAAAHGYRGDVCCFSGAAGTNVPPGNYLVLGSIGATARVGDSARFVYEAGFGQVFAHFTDRDQPGKVFYLNIGVIFHTHGTNTRTQLSSRSSE